MAERKGRRGKSVAELRAWVAARLFRSVKRGVRSRHTTYWNRRAFANDKNVDKNDEDMFKNMSHWFPETTIVNSAHNKE